MKPKAVISALTGPYTITPAATYSMPRDTWVVIPEAGVRARLTRGAPAGPILLFVDEAGQLHSDQIGWIDVDRPGLDASDASPAPAGRGRPKLDRTRPKRPTA